MEFNKAREITRTFIRSGNKMEPILGADWVFSIENNRILLNSELNNLSIPISTLEDFTKKYTFNSYFNISGNNLIGVYYYTSAGLFNEDEYNLALDIIESNKRIPEKDLIEGNIYLSEAGREYVFVKISEKYIYKANVNILGKHFLNWSGLVDLDTCKILKVSSIKLIEDTNTKLEDEIYVYNFNYYKYSHEVFTEIKFSIDKIKDEVENNTSEYAEKHRVENIDEFNKFIVNNESNLLIIQKPFEKRIIPKGEAYANHMVYILFEDLNINSGYTQQRLFNELVRSISLEVDVEKTSISDINLLFSRLCIKVPHYFFNDYVIMTHQGNRALLAVLSKYGNSRKVINAIAAFDWRAYNHKSVVLITEKEEKLKFKGSSGYKYIKDNLLAFVDKEIQVKKSYLYELN